MANPDRRARAEGLLPDRVAKLLYNAQVRPHWIAGTDRFWYRANGPEGELVVVVNAADGTREISTDPAALAASTPKPGRDGETISPDGRYAAYRHDNDLWVRDTVSNVTRPLTNDGAPHHAYAKSPDGNLTTVSLRRRGVTLPAVVLWSPNGRQLFTHRLDERAVKDWPLIQHVPDDGGARPIAHVLKVAQAGDSHLATQASLVIAVDTGRIVPTQRDDSVAGVTTAIERAEAWWSADSTRVFFLDRDRISRRVTLCEMNATTGATRDVITETERTFVDVNLSVTGLPNIRVLDETDEIIWFSQRDGWAHLYLYDLSSGAEKARITDGEWMVRDIVRVDTASRRIFFLAGGVDPAVDPTWRTLCAVDFDGGGFAVLTPEPADHALAMPQAYMPRDHIRPKGDVGEAFSPSGSYFVHTHGTLERMPVSELRRVDGAKVATLETATLDPALADFRFPKHFRAKAADKKTDLFGAIWLPTDFDPSRRYPVIDYIYPGPQRGQTPTTMFPDSPGELFRTCIPAAFAELGFVVLNVDGRGTPLRDKKFHEHSYGRLDDPGCLEDHVAVLDQLAIRHPFLDVERVGIMGHSGGGYGSVRALIAFPERFHAAVATSGNHDQKGYSYSWAEKFQGPFVRAPDGTTNYDAAANPPLAHRIRGKLFLATGDMDDNVHPALTLQLVDALIKADKNFEFLVIPNADHTNVWTNPYFLRRAMDFLVDALGA